MIVYNQGSNPGLLKWECRVLATGSPGKSQPIDLLVACCLVSMWFFFSHFSFCSQFLVLYHCGWKKCLMACLVVWYVIDLEHSKHTWKECVFWVFLDVVSCRYQLSPTALVCHLGPLLLYWFSAWIICPLMSVDFKVHYYYCIIVSFFFST